MSDSDNSAEQNFNDSELQDIMNEIESLEKEFVEQEASEESSAEVEMDNVQDLGPVAEEVEEPVAEEVEEPVAEEVEESVTEEVEYHADHEVESDKTDEEVVAHMDADEDSLEIEEDFSNELEDNIVSMENHPATSEQIPTGGMSFSGHGQMDFNMNFALGGQEAKLVVEEGKLKVMVSGGELYLSEDGCEVEMSGGVHFSIPFDRANDNARKKAS